MTKQIGQEETLNLQKDWQPEIKAAKEALENTDKEKYPKLYAERKKLADTLQYNENMRARAEKAENAAKKLENETPKNEEDDTSKNTGEPQTPINEGLSLQDIRALNDVHDDDIQIVRDWAGYKKISVAEAKKEPHIQSLLRTRQEERKTAQASNTGKSKKGASKTSGSELLKKAEKSGELPDIEDEKAWKDFADARYK